MSSANLVSVTYVPEAEYGVTPSPLSGVTLDTARFTSESLSGTPTTTESQLIRSDRLSSGQVATGLDTGGGIDFELCRGTFFDDFLGAGMMNDWVAASDLSTDVTLTPNGLDPQLATLTVTGDLSTIPVVAGDVLQLIPAAGSPVVVQVISVTSTTEAEVATMRDQAAIVSESMTVSLPSHTTIGKTQKSFTVSKAYTDILHDSGSDEHSQRYTGSLVSTVNVSATYGEIVTGSFGTLGNGYLQEAPSLSQQVVTAGGTVNPADTSLPLNASIDVPLVTASGVASTYCVESFTIDLDNGLDPTQCIGKLTATGYTLGTAAINVTANIYASDTAYDTFMAEKLTQEKISMMFTMINTDGGYSFSLQGIQLNFPDPASEGLNQQTMLNATGTGSVGPNGESSLTIYRLVGDQ